MIKFTNENNTCESVIALTKIVVIKHEKEEKYLKIYLDNDKQYTHEYTNAEEGEKIMKLWENYLKGASNAS